jgi:class 3 adenylate cyclase
VFADAFIFVSDLRGFTRVTRSEPIPVVERLLDTLDTQIHAVVRQFEGTIRISDGDSYCLTFHDAEQLVAAAERLSLNWDTANREGRLGCAINIALHRGRMSIFRSFLYGEGPAVAKRLQAASNRLLPDKQGGVFVTSAVRDALSNSTWRSRLQPVVLDLRDAPVGLRTYQLTDGSQLKLPG